MVEIQIIDCCPIFTVDGRTVDNKVGFRAWRQENELSTVEAGEMLSVSHRTIENWEQGRTIPDDKLYKLYHRQEESHEAIIL